jgi:hypothetical protein
MELKYRGAFYNFSPSTEAGETVEQMTIYRGVSYRAKMVKASLRQPGEELIYRGVRYNR